MQKRRFLQSKLIEESSYLTTFNTPIGRYRWLRLPFGISSASEVYQRIMDEMLEGIPGAFAVIDDILIAGESIEKHDEILKKVLHRACDYNLKLNFDKVNLRKEEVPYVGHIITKDGIKPDPNKVQAVQNMPHPTSKNSLRRFLGFVTYLSKFLPNLSTATEPLRKLLKDDTLFEWTENQEKAFQQIKKLCTSNTVLKLFDVNKAVEIQCDASSTGLGAVLLQDGRPVAYSSRALTDTETRYAQIEKELLSIVFACKQFHCYIFGKPTLVLNDHKPLEAIFKKPLHMSPLRLQRMLLFLQWYDLTVQYEKGNNMTLPDTLSRAYTEPPEELQEKDIPISYIVTISEEAEDRMKAATDQEFKQLKEIIIQGWPDNKNLLPIEVLPYWKYKSDLTIMDGFILKGNQILIPPTCRQNVLKLIHSTHLGIVKCKQRAREVVYWPGMNTDIEELINNCESCAAFQKHQPNQPLKPLPLPNFPFERISLDIFEFQGKNYLLCVDGYSKFIMVHDLNNLTTSEVIKNLKQIISCHGIPIKIVTDSGSQFTSMEIKEFCKTYGIQLHTVSPNYQRANGMAERAIQTVKKLWKKGSDKRLAILDYNSTPLEAVNLSPAQLLMSRRPRNMLPTSNKVLQPKIIDHAEVQDTINTHKYKQKKWHDSLPSKELQSLSTGQDIRVAPMPGQQEWFPAVVKSKLRDRTYLVENKSNQNKYIRNRVHIKPSTAAANRTQQSNNMEHILEEMLDEPITNEHSNEQEKKQSPLATQEVSQPPNQSIITTRSGRRVRAPDKLDL